MSNDQKNTNRHPVATAPDDGAVMETDGFFDSDQTGFENVDRESLVMPILRIAQKGTPAADKHNPAYIDGLEPGDFYSTASRRSFSSEVRMVLLSYHRSIVKWGANLGNYMGVMSANDFEAIKPDLVREGANWRDSDDNRYQDTRNFFVMLPDYLEEGILLYPMHGSGIRASRQLLTRARMVRRNGKPVPLFAPIWRISTMYIDDGTYTYHQISDRTVLNASVDGYCPPDLRPAVVDAVATVSTYQDEVTPIDMSAVRDDQPAQQAEPQQGEFAF